MTDEDLLELAAGLAASAGAAIRAVRAAGFAVERKPDRSPVTEADRVAEALIVEGLREATPGIPVLAEEAASAGAPFAWGPRAWLVDPLDGTRGFAEGAGDYAVNVGLVREGRAVLGAVALPATGEVFGGIVAPGLAWKEDAGGRRAVRARRPPGAGLDVLASRHHGDEARLSALLTGRRVASVTRVGSALKFCRIAEGAADLYPNFGGTLAWDTAAPQAVLEAAGGRVETRDGAALRYGAPGHRNPAFVARGAG